MSMGPRSFVRGLRSCLRFQLSDLKIGSNAFCNVAHGWRGPDFFFGHLVKNLFTNRNLKKVADSAKMDIECCNLVKMHIFEFCWLL